MDILQLGLLVLLGKLMPPLLPVQSQLRQDFKKKDDGLQALGLESFHCKSARYNCGKMFLSDRLWSFIFFSNDYLDFKKKTWGGSTTTTTSQENLNNHFFFGSFPQKNVPTTSLARGLVGTLGIHDALLKVGLPDEELQIPWTSAMWTLEVKWWNARRKMAPKIAMNYHGKRRSNIHVLIYFVRIIYIHICIYFLALCIYKYKLCSIVYCLLCVDALFIISQYKIYLKGGKTWTESYEASGTLPFGERWVNLSAVPAATKTHNSNLTGSIVSKQPNT